MLSVFIISVSMLGAAFVHRFQLLRPVNVHIEEQAAGRDGGCVGVRLYLYSLMFLLCLPPCC